MKVRTGRLLRLARHLRKGKLAHKIFYFGAYNITVIPKPGTVFPLRAHLEPETCGTQGCAWGECPVLWPKQLMWDGNAVRTRRGATGFAINDAAKFFGLTYQEAIRIFVPGKLTDRATKEQVAREIEDFCREARDRNK